MQEYSTSAANCRDDKSEYSKHKNRDVGVRVYGVRHTDDMLNQMGKRETKPCGDRDGPRTRAPDNTGGSSRNKQQGDNYDWTNFTPKCKIVHGRYNYSKCKSDGGQRLPPNLRIAFVYVYSPPFLLSDGTSSPGNVAGQRKRGTPSCGLLSFTITVTFFQRHPSK